MKETRKEIGKHWKKNLQNNPKYSHMEKYYLEFKKEIDEELNFISEEPTKRRK